jgi:rare lipoprotein A
VFGVGCAAPAAQVTTTSVSPPADVPATLAAQIQEAEKLDDLPPVTVSHAKKPPIDHSGRSQSGKASYYGKRFNDHEMSDGNRFNPSDNVAASKTLPIGTTAKVTNLDTGKSATVKVEDRGPHVDGRVIDVSPSVAGKLDMKKAGVTPVEVKPIAVPQPDGGVKLGAGAVETTPAQVQQAVKTTQQLAQ